MPTELTPFLPHLWTTLVHRPYVFVFLICFLTFGTLQLGWRRTLGFLMMGWIIAFASEASSIRNGFPYGNYQYIYENLKGELLLWGVPLWDSLSYTFLAYASYSTAVFVFLTKWVARPEGAPHHPAVSAKGGPRSAGGYGSDRTRFEDAFLKIRTSWKVLLLTVILMTGIDVIIDPLTALGDQWFLGKIYYYPEGGIYFGVPLSNFFGWGLVAFAITFTFQRWDQHLEKTGNLIPQERWKGLRGILGVALYLGVFIFNWIITLWIGQWILALADLGLVAPLIIFPVRKKCLLSSPIPSPSKVGKADKALSS